MGLGESGPAESGALWVTQQHLCLNQEREVLANPQNYTPFFHKATLKESDCDEVHIRNSPVQVPGLSQVQPSALVQWPCRWLHYIPRVP